MDPNLITWMRNKLKRHDSDLADMTHKYSEDFLVGMPQKGSWYGSAVASGGYSAGRGTPLHPGLLVYVSHASNANSGYAFLTDSTPILLSGGEKCTAFFKTAPTLTGVTRRIGFRDAAATAAPVNGVYCSIIDGTISGRCVDNNTLSTTSTNLLLSANTFYKLKIELNADATLATFTLYEDNSNTILWQDTLSTNIPKIAAGREVGHGDTCTLASPSAATTIGSLDYIDAVLPNSRRVD